MPDFETAPGSPVEISAKPASGLWTLAHPFLDGAALLRLSACHAERWAYAPGRDAICDANGDPNALIKPTVCLMPKAAVGTLVGKIGGSTAGLDDGTMFVVGKECVLKVPENGGPLFMTINDTFDGMSNNDGCLHVDVAIAQAEPHPVGGGEVIPLPA